MSKRETMEKLLENTRKSLAANPSSMQLNSVLLPVIRRVMPTVIAHDICGVQPMTGPFVSDRAKSWNPETCEVVFGWLWGDWITKIEEWCAEHGIRFTIRDGDPTPAYTMAKDPPVNADTIFVFNDATDAMLCYLRFK